MIRLIMIGGLLTLSLVAGVIEDADMDGVVDSMDACPNTPFLHEVNAKGCTSNILTLPNQTERDSMTLVLGYGYSTNEDIEGFETQHIQKLHLGYYHDSWSYALKVGYYEGEHEDGFQDTLLKIKKRFKPKSNLKLNLGIGVKLPSYDFKGNKTDFLVTSSLYYYPRPSLSFYTGFQYTFVRDDEMSTPLQNSVSFYLGSGYFINKDFYMSFGFNHSTRKFKKEEASNALSSTFYYKINADYFCIFSYSREILDEDLHDGVNVKLGYTLW